MWLLLAKNNSQEKGVAMDCKRQYYCCVRGCWGMGERMGQGDLVGPLNSISPSWKLCEGLWARSQLEPSPPGHLPRLGQMVY